MRKSGLRRWKKLIVLGIAGACGISLARADEEQRSTPTISGRIFTDFYVPSGSPLGSPLQQVSGSIWLESDPRLSEDSRAHFTLTGDHFQASTPGNSGLRWSLREAFVDYNHSGWSFRAGRMIIPWGKSDAINPTDFLTAKDSTFFNPDEEVKRIGALSVSLAWTPSSGNSPWTFHYILTPVFPQSTLLLAPEQIPGSIRLSSTDALPARNLGNAENAFKVAYSGVGWDASLSFFHGWNHLPAFQINSAVLSPAVSLEVSRFFQRYRVLGADGSTSWGSWIFRWETAYVWTENNDGQNPLLQPTHWDTVVGLERPLLSSFRVQMQVLTRYFPRFLSPQLLSSPVDRQVALVNALIQNYQDPTRVSGTLRLSYSDEGEALGGEIFILGNFIGGGYLLRPQLNYAWTGDLKVSLGLDFYGGPEDRPLGVLAPYNSIFSEVKYVF